MCIRDSIVLVDWSDIREQKRLMVLRASVALHGRSVTLYELSLIHIFLAAPLRTWATSAPNLSHGGAGSPNGAMPVSYTHLI